MGGLGELTWTCSACKAASSANTSSSSWAEIRLESKALTSYEQAADALVSIHAQRSLLTAGTHSKARKGDAYLLIRDAFPRVVHELLYGREVHLLI